LLFHYLKLAAPLEERVETKALTMVAITSVRPDSVESCAPPAAVMEAAATQPCQKEAPVGDAVVSSSSVNLCDSDFIPDDELSVSSNFIIAPDVMVHSFHDALTTSVPSPVLTKILPSPFASWYAGSYVYPPSHSKFPDHSSTLGYCQPLATFFKSYHLLSVALWRSISGRVKYKRYVCIVMPWVHAL
jgi:hypothetical protein